MTHWKVTAHTILLLSLVCLPGILTLNSVNVNVYGQNFTSLTITLSSSTVPVLTGTVTVSAHLSGETAAAVGDTVTYQLFSSASCSPGTIVQSDPQTIQPGLVVPPSTSFTMMSPPLPSSSPAGTFSFNAVYSGDANNRPSTSLCKQITVTKTPTTTTTSITPPLTITAGGSVTDTATLSGTNIFAGTVQFRLYLGASCSGNVLQSNTIPFSGVGPYSDTFTIPNPGTYSLRASYSGDSLDLGSTSPCELGVTVTKQSPTLTTTSIPLLPASITFGGSIVDTASLTGGTSNAGGTVTYNLFSNAGCAGTPVQTSPVTVTNGIVPNSKSFIINSGGSYSLKAVYSGDKNNAGPVSSSCEATLTVGKSAPSITLSFVPPTPTIFVGQSLTVSASLSGATFNAGGTVQYDLYSDAGCLSFIAAHTVTVSFGHVPNTSFITTLASMSYHVTATYSGDASNAPSGPSGCSAGGTAIVKQVTPSISTQLSTTTVAPFGSVTDSATLSGTSGNTAGDQVIYTMYSTGNCMGPPVGAPTTVFIINGGGVPSVTLIANAAGSYSFQAVFQGDTNNNPATSACEPFTVQLFTPSISTQLSATTIVFGGTVTDLATLANAGAPAGGSVTYNLYSNGACTGTIVQADTETVTNGIALTSKPLAPNSGGTFGVQAVYNGDGIRNNPSAPSSCEVLTVNQVSTQISTMLALTTISVGSTATDTAKLTGFAPNAGGTVTFSIYAGSACSGTAIDTSSPISVVNGVPVSAYTTPTFQAGSGGPYSISAVYSGDTNNAGATSACNELLSVQETPTLSTVLSAATIEALQPITDSATLSGATSQNHWPAGGTVTYALYSGGSCSNAALDTMTVTVANGVVPSTTFPGTDFSTPGPYSIKARYSGDSYNAGASATCESFTVTPATSSISTQLSVSQIFTDGSITDLATLSGVTANAGGSVTYSLYPNGVCGGSIATDTENVVNGVVPTSTPFHVPNSGTFSIQATYSPDANNSPATSSCEVFTAVLHSPTISTQLSATSISLGGTITDSATLANSGATAGGSVTYNLYSNGACTGTIVQADTESVTNGVVPTSAPLAPNSGGTFGVQAVYNGDANNSGQKSSCEAFTVSPVSLTTQLSATIVSTAGSISDSATLSGATSNAGGTVTYTLYAGPTCLGAVQGVPATLTVTNGVVPNSGVFQLSNLSPATGSFSFQAVYSGDANNKGVTSTCEPFSVVMASPSISTQLSATTITAGGSVTDTATLMGATSNAGNTVTYTMYAGSSCSGTILGKYIETLINGFVPTSGVFTAITAGTYSFQAVYSGDTGNNGATSACEILIATAQKSSPTISTQLSTTSITVFGSVTDKATLTGATSNAGGTVTFTMYNGGSCSGGSVGSDIETVTNGVVPTSSAFGTSAVGLNSFQAVYSGDTNNNGATSPCEVLTVNPASPTISIILSSNTILHGGSVTISSGLIGATSNAGGTVTLTMYTGGTCSGSVVGSPDVLTVTSGVVPMSSPFFANTAGSFSFQAVYSGDANNMAATSACTILTST